MEVILKTSNIKIENYLKRVGIANMKQQKLFSMCHLIKEKGKTKVVHFKEVMQLQEQLYRKEFIDLCINGFGGELGEDERPYVFPSNVRFNYIHEWVDVYSFNNPIRGLSIDTFRVFIEQIFLAINMDRFRGVQTNTYKSLENCIYNFIEDEIDKNNNVFFKKDLVMYIDENYTSTIKGNDYSTVAPLMFDDQILKRRYLKLLEEKEMIEVVGEYDRDVPPFEVFFTNKYTGDVTKDPNSQFINLNEEDEMELFFEPTKKVSIELDSERKPFGVLYDVTGKIYSPISKHNYTEDIISFGDKKWLVINMFEYILRKTSVPAKFIIWSK